MSTLAITDPQNPDDLSRDEWWALFDDLRLRQQAAYAEYGGSQSFLRAERDTHAPE